MKTENETKTVLKLELENKNYNIDNIPDHITQFVNSQTKSTTQNNYSIGLVKFYNYLIDTETNEVNQANINQTIKGYRKYLLDTKKLASTTIDNYTEIFNICD